jgi:small conductance mechanosensitive channel
MEVDHMNLGKVAAPVVDKLIIWVETVVKMLPNILVAVFCVALFWLLAIVVGWLVRRMTLRLSIYRHVARLMGSLSRLIVVTAGVLLALYALNLDRAVASMLAGIGIVGLAFGFAAKNTGGDYLAGFLIHFTHPYRVGHLIQSGTFIGHVDSIEVRATKIRTQQGQSVIIPNRKIVENELTNYTVTGERRVDLKCGISQDTDLQKAEDVAIKAVESLKTRNPERAVELFYEEFGDSSVNFTLRFWTDPDQKAYLTARSEAIKAIQWAFKEHGITMANPTRTLDFSAPKGGSLREQIQGIEWLSAPRETKPPEKTGNEQKAKSAGKIGAGRRMKREA